MPLRSFPFTRANHVLFLICPPAQPPATQVCVGGAHSNPVLEATEHHG